MMFFIGALENKEKSKLEQLYIKYGRVAYMIACGMLHDTAGAEDATHQTFLLLADHLDKVTDIRSKRTGNYIVSIVKNYCRTLLRKKKYQIVDDDIENLAFEIPDDSARLLRIK